MTDEMSSEQLVALVRDATDEQLAQGMEANRDAILHEIFRRMPESLDPARAGDIDAVVDWQILDRPDGGADRFQVVIRDGACTVTSEGSEEPDVTYKLGPVDFLKLVSGVVTGPELFVFGRLSIDGDLVLAARMPSLFSLPSS
jgi:hypothetical protein